MKKIRAVIVGCGNIAGSYAEQILRYENVELVGFSDLAGERAETLAGKFGGVVFAGLDDVLADNSINLVVNLTIHHAHVEVIEKCLHAGKHVHTEKPLALCAADAIRLADLAEAKGLRLSSAPSTFLGETAQTAARAIREGKLGTLRLAYAEMNHGRIEAWHPNPAPFYQVGPVWDIGVYPLGIWAALCGPMRRVTACGKTLLGNRTTKSGQSFSIAQVDYVTAMIEFECGLLGRLTVNFYARPSRQGATMEFHGDLGALHLASSTAFNASVEFATTDGAFEEVALARPGFAGTEFARGVEELADAILTNRPHRCDGRMAAHIVEVIEAIHTSIRDEVPVNVSSGFSVPAPMPWAMEPPAT